jgi:hypothetical protein
MMRLRATRSMLLLLLSGALAACASSSPSGQQGVIRPSEGTTSTAGISPDKEAEVQLVLQQREVSTRKCYQDVLNEKNDRNFQGTVKVLIALGTNREATDVRVVGGTLNDQDVQSCLVSTIKRFEFPELTQPGEVQSEFRFQPAY